MQNKPDAGYRQRQEAQLARYLEWARQQPDAVGAELPTRIDTLLKSEQLARLNWLKENVIGNILEVGCSWGFVLAWVGGHAGVDISDGPLELARLLAPGRQFYHGSALQLPFEDKSFDTVMLPDILEHLSYPDEVERAINEAARVARKRLLATFPDGREDSEEACNFKHLWLPDEQRIHEIYWRFWHHTRDLLAILAPRRPDATSCGIVSGSVCIRFDLEGA